MFTVLTALVCYSLLTFGAVLPHSWLALTIFWVLGIAVCCVSAIARHRKIGTPLLVLFIAASLLVGFLPAKFATGLVAGLWAWAATRMHPERSIRFLHLLVIIGVAEALMGLVQFFISPGWIFGYVNEHYRSSGTLINRNHFAGLLEMIIPSTFGLAYIATRRYADVARPYLYVLTGSFLGLALLFSVSRMGIFSFVVTIFFLSAVLRLRKAQRKVAALLAFGIVGLVLAGALWVGVDVIVLRYSTLLGEEALMSEVRVPVFRDIVRMIQLNPWGVGIGNFQDQFRQHQLYRPDLMFDHAHNDYLETAAEWGVAISVAAWIFVCFILIRGIRLFAAVNSPERRGILLACIGAIFSILIHSLTDFNLQIPSNAMLFFTFAGICLGMPSLTMAESKSR